ncbi:dienelactone hydrolase family protein [Aliifodinibius sp. S!AR15-10]|uniref:dienelactone hydrolase family protein n=1 Tax=Aliifodinibius sp. S!AR15-10 TaxID=2950437 RepID=UPI0028573286|nr:dienelactone hydrolase family protein [Aliifodinibius sp. S!AR15-10]MDR8394006.1 dienelactone hydrolase family protein [Aliifodinibius sp. S!AR15-10]
MYKRTVDIEVGAVQLKGNLALPDRLKGIVLFSHGSGSNRLSARNRSIANNLRQQGFGTLLFDLLTPAENKHYSRWFDIELLTRRLISVTNWLLKSRVSNVNIGYFGANTGAASALAAAAELGSEMVRAIVCRDGRPDLVQNTIPHVKSPTLLLVGGHDKEVLEANEAALHQLQGIKKLTVIAGASHLFEVPGQLGDVTNRTAEWFTRYLYYYPKEIEKDFMG